MLHGRGIYLSRAKEEIRSKVAELIYWYSVRCWTMEVIGDAGITGRPRNKMKWRWNRYKRKIMIENGHVQEKAPWLNVYYEKVKYFDQVEVEEEIATSVNINILYPTISFQEWYRQCKTTNLRIVLIDELKKLAQFFSVSVTRRQSGIIHISLYHIMFQIKNSKVRPSALDLLKLAQNVLQICLRLRQMLLRQKRRR